MKHPAPQPSGGETQDLKVRQRLLEAATSIFSMKGYAAASVSEIVAAAGVTKPILYYYFDNKEGIYLEIIRDAYSKLDILLDQASRWEGAVPDRIRRLTHELFDLFLEKREAARMVYSVYYGPPQSAPAYDFDAHRAHHHEMLKRLVEEGIAHGEILSADPEDLTIAITALLSVAMEMELCKSGPKIDQAGLDRILDLLYRGISVQKTER